MRKLLSLLALVLLCAPAAFADSRAQEVLKQAREAIGGEEQLQKIQGLHINGQYRRVFGDRQMGGDREISILLPNKYLVEDAMNAGGHQHRDDQYAWTERRASMERFKRRRWRNDYPHGWTRRPEADSGTDRSRTAAKHYSAEFSRYLLAMILTPPPSLAVEYKYAGESDVEDVQADVIDVTAPDNFAVRIFFDKKTSPAAAAELPWTKAAHHDDDPPGRWRRKPEDIKKAREEAEKKLQAEAPARPGRSRLLHSTYRPQKSRRRSCCHTS